MPPNTSATSASSPSSTAASSNDAGRDGGRSATGQLLGEGQVPKSDNGCVWGGEEGESVECEPVDAARPLCCPSIIESLWWELCLIVTEAGFHQHAGALPGTRVTSEECVTPWIGATVPPVWMRIRCCSSRSGIPARRCSRSKRRSRYVGDATSETHAFNGRWKQARIMVCGADSARTSGER